VALWSKPDDGEGVSLLEVGQVELPEGREGSGALRLRGRGVEGNMKRGCSGGV
jgi:hypothetical protein